MSAYRVIEEELISGGGRVQPALATKSLVTRKKYHMTTATLTTNRSITEQKVRFGGYWLTLRQINAYIEAAERKREKLKVQARKRGPIILDSEYDQIVYSMAAWKERWLRRVAR